MKLRGNAICPATGEPPPLETRIAGQPRRQVVQP